MLGIHAVVRKYQARHDARAARTLCTSARCEGLQIRPGLRQATGRVGGARHARSQQGFEGADGRGQQRSATSATARASALRRQAAKREGLSRASATRLSTGASGVHTMARPNSANRSANWSW